jgi:hypothetical protein
VTPRTREPHITVPAKLHKEIASNALHGLQCVRSTPPNHPPLRSRLNTTNIRDAAVKVPIVHANALLMTARSTNRANFHERNRVARVLLTRSRMAGFNPITKGLSDESESCYDCPDDNSPLTGIRRNSATKDDTALAITRLHLTVKRKLISDSTSWLSQSRLASCLHLRVTDRDKLRRCSYADCRKALWDRRSTVLQ